MLVIVLSQQKEMELSRVLGAMGASLSYFDGQSEEEEVIVYLTGSAGWRMTWAWGRFN